MNLYSTNKTEDDVPINETGIFNLFEDIRVLKEELRSWITQRGCECGHSKCANCKDTKDALELLNT